MSLNVIRDGSLAAVSALPAGARPGEVINVINLGTASASLVDSSTQSFKNGALVLATNESAELVWTGVKWIELNRQTGNLPLRVNLTPGLEGAVVANAFDVVGSVTDISGSALTAAVEVMIRSLAVTADQGDLAAAGTPVGTVKKAVNPATGENVMWMTTDAAGLFSFRVTDTAVEDLLLQVFVNGGLALTQKLTYA